MSMIELRHSLATQGVYFIAKVKEISLQVGRSHLCVGWEEKEGSDHYLLHINPFTHHDAIRVKTELSTSVLLSQIVSKKF